MFTQSSESGGRRKGRSPHSFGGQALNNLTATNPLDITPQLSSPFHDRQQMHIESNKSNIMGFNLSQRHSRLPQSMLAQPHFSNSFNVNNEKNYARNMQMLNDIKSKLPLNQLVKSSRQADMMRTHPNTSPVPNQSQFEQQTLAEHESARNHHIVMNTRQYATVNADHFIESIQKRAQTASKSAVGGSTRRRNMGGAGARINHSLRRPQENKTVLGADQASASKAITRRAIEYQKSAANPFSQVNVASQGAEGLQYSNDQQNSQATQQMTKKQMIALTASPMSAFSGKSPTRETYDPLTASQQESICSDKKMPDNANVSKMLTAPLYALSKPIKKFRLSLSKNQKSLRNQALEAESRLYEHSKTLHHTFKRDPLKYLECMTNELNHNYEMFEKRSNAENIQYVQEMKPMLLSRLGRDEFLEEPNLLKASKASPREDGVDTTSQVNNSKVQEQIFMSGEVLVDHRSEAPQQAESASGVAQTAPVMPQHTLSTTMTNQWQSARSTAGGKDSSKLGHSDFSVDQTVLMVQESLRKTLEERQQSHPQMDIQQEIKEVSSVHRAVLLAVNTLTGGQPSIGHALSLLWKYLIIIVDQCLNAQENRFDELQNKFDNHVQVYVDEKCKRFETERLSLEAKINRGRDEIEELEKTIEMKTQQCNKLHDQLVSSELRFESLRDPTGLQQFKRLINSFTSGIDTIYAEKEQQYTTMKAVCRIMEDMDTQNEEKQGKETQKDGKYKAIIEQLQAEKAQLEDQLEKNKLVPLTRKILNPDREAARDLRRKMTMNVMNNSQQHKMTRINELPVTDDMASLIKGSSVNTDGLKAIRLLCAQQLSEIVEKDVRDEFIDFYQSEIVKARKMGMDMMKQELDENGQIKPGATSKILAVMQNYFSNLANGKPMKKRGVAKKRVAKGHSNGGRRAASGQDDGDDTQELSDELGSQYSGRSGRVSGARTKANRKKRSSHRVNKLLDIDDDDKTSSFAKTVGGRKGTKLRFSVDMVDESDINSASGAGAGNETSRGQRRGHPINKRRSTGNISGTSSANYSRSDDDSRDLDNEVNRMGQSPNPSPSKSHRGLGRSFDNRGDEIGFDEYDSGDEFPEKVKRRRSRRGTQPGSAQRSRDGSLESPIDRGDQDSETKSFGSFGNVATNLKKVQEIKSKINTGLADAEGSKNSRIIKKQLDLMKNPIISAIKKTLKLNEKNNKKLPKDYNIAMVPSKIYELMDNVMQEKVWVDLESEGSTLENRSAVPFHTFMYDVMIMKFGLQSIAIKTLIQMTNGLNFEQKSNPFAHTMSNMLGMAVPPYRLDEIQIVLRSHLLFKMAQENWMQRVKVNHKYLEITKEDESNIHRGGNCSIFDLLEELKFAFKDDKEIQERIMGSIKPDILLKSTPDRHHKSIRFTILKVTNKIAKMGKDPKWVYNQLDRDGNGTLDGDEILLGIKSVLGITFSQAETLSFINHLDEDKSGDIDKYEFCQKINLDNIHRESHRFLISELTFIEKVLNEWYHFKKREQKRILELIDEYDENKDGVMQLSEFEALLQFLEPNVTKKNIINLFKQALSMADDQADADAIAPEILMRLILHYKIGGYGKEFFSNYLNKRKSKFLEKKKKK